MWLDVGSQSVSVIWCETRFTTTDSDTEINNPAATVVQCVDIPVISTCLFQAELKFSFLFSKTGFINQSGLIIQHLGLRKNWRQYLTVNTFYADFFTNPTFILECLQKFQTYDFNKYLFYLIHLF